MKAATIMQDRSIMVLARGKVPGMKEQIGTILLQFDVVKSAGRMVLRLREGILKMFPSVFPR